MPDASRGPAMTDRRLDDRLLFAAEREADGLAPREDLAELLMEARAELRRLRSLFSGEDERLLRATRSDVELQGWEHNGELIAPALDDLARRIREARGEPSA
jgi:hypothetical protein